MTPFDNLHIQKLKKLPFWFHPLMSVFFFAGMGLANLGIFARRPLDADPVFRPQQTVAHMIQKPPIKFQTFARSASPQGTIMSFQPASLASAALKVPHVENSVKMAESKPTTKVILAVGKSLMSQESSDSLTNQDRTRLREQVTNLQNLNLSVNHVYTLEHSYSSMVRNLLRQLHANFETIKPEFTQYRITRPDKYQARSQDLSGLSGVRENGSSVNLTKQNLHNLFTGTADRQARTVEQFGIVFETESASQIAGELQNILTGCQNAYAVLRHKELAMPTLGTGLERLATDLNLPDVVRTSSPRDVKVYWKPFESVDCQLAGSFNFSKQDVSLGVGQARFQKIPKTRAGFVYGADVGPKFRRITGPPLSYRYSGIEGRVFLGVGLEI